jgi:murein DD-endopeptidase MepM/ murein hydrolase activator NlpD
MKNWFVTLLFCLLATPAFALELALPVACEVGSNCWVQQYVDHDAGPGATDYSCGVASYDGHDGTDIRVLNTAAKVDLLAAAAGTVKAVRDGVADHLVKTDADKAAVDKIECGNGVVLDHGDGWETQYCHLRKGSIAVKTGDVVSAGGVLGQIGYSGNAAFPHVHLSVRQNGRSVDPFSIDAVKDCKAADRSLWNSHARKALAYKDTQLLQLRWVPGIYKDADVDHGSLPEFQHIANELVLMAEVVNLHKGDVMTVTVTFPGRTPIINSVVMKNNRAVQRLYAGKLFKGSWPVGIAKGRIDISRQSVIVLSKDKETEMKALILND